MGYIVLNGIPSTSIKGLLIQSLPPISKPPVRIQTEEIDGRDGDIVTTLGYGAYDKTIEIGLHGNYDVDEVIAYFVNNASGEVTFSDEFGKYYDYQIIQQINFERLIRFKTAKVVFHVQPFKYSCVDRKFVMDNQFLEIKDYSAIKNGVTVTAKDGTISVVGTASEVTAFVIPIESVTLPIGSYSMRISTTGTNAENCLFGLMDDDPIPDELFGGGIGTLNGKNTVVRSDEIISPKTFNNIILYVNPNFKENIKIRATVYEWQQRTFTVTNRGNIQSKPKITVYGSGTVNLMVNGKTAFVISLGQEDWLTIDPAKLDAYQGNTERNRSVSGDYDALILPIGKSTISWTGIVSKVIVEDFTRWI